MSIENPKRPPVEALKAKLAAIDEHKHDPLGGVGDCEHCDAMDVYELALRNAAPDLFRWIRQVELQRDQADAKYTRYRQLTIENDASFAVPLPDDVAKFGTAIARSG